MKRDYDVEEQVMRRHSEVGATDGRLLVNLRRVAIQEPDGPRYRLKRMFFWPMRGSTELYFDVENRAEEGSFETSDVRFDEDFLQKLFPTEILDADLKDGFDDTLRLTIIVDTVDPGMIDHVVRHLPWHLSGRDPGSPVVESADGVEA